MGGLVGAALGAAVPLLVVQAATRLDELAPALTPVLLVVHGLVTLPGWVVPLRGAWTLAFVALCWSALGFVAGRRLAARVGRRE